MKLELNEEKLAEALAMVLNDKTLQQKLSKNGRSRWEQSYTAENMGDATIVQYKKLLTKKESISKNNITIRRKKGRKLISYITTAFCPDTFLK